MMASTYLFRIPQQLAMIRQKNDIFFNLKNKMLLQKQMKERGCRKYKQTKKNTQSGLAFLQQHHHLHLFTQLSWTPFRYPWFGPLGRSGSREEGSKQLSVHDPLTRSQY
jgi:hypothetical protein